MPNAPVRSDIGTSSNLGASSPKVAVAQPSIIRVKLNDLKSATSSSDYSGGVNAFLSILDLVFTVPRITQVVSERLGLHSPNFISISAEHPWIAALAVGGSTLLALGHLGVYLDKLQDEKDKNNAGYLLKKFIEKKNVEKQHSEMDVLVLFNSYLENYFAQDAKLYKRYASIRLEKDNEKREIYLAFTPKVKEKEKEEKAKSDASKIWNLFCTKVGPIYDALGLSAYTYWIVWISNALFTNVLSTGVEIAGSHIYAFAGVLAVGAVYLGIKIFNYFFPEHKIENAAVHSANPNEEVAEAAKSKVYKDTLKIIRNVELYRQVAAAAEKNNEEAKSLAQKIGVNDLPDAASVDAQANIAVASLESEDQKRKSNSSFSIEKVKAHLLRNKELVIASAGLSCLGAYVVAQFNAWILFDILAVGAHIVFNPANLILSGILIGIAAGVGIHQVIKKKQEFDNDARIIEKNQKLIEQIESNYKTIHQNKLQISQLQKEILQLAKGDENKKALANIVKVADLEEAKPSLTVISTLEKVKDAVMSVQTGIFIFRLVAIAGSAIFIPMVIGLPPGWIAFGVMLAIGVVHGAITMYRNHVEEQEKKDRETLHTLCKDPTRVKLQLEHTTQNVNELTRRLSILKRSPGSGVDSSSIQSSGSEDSLPSMVLQV